MSAEPHHSFLVRNKRGVSGILNDSGASFTCCPPGFISGRLRLRLLAIQPDPALKIMNSELVKAAVEVIHSQQILVNVVSRRVRQLSLGHRPMIEFVPGLGHADIALSEIIQGKLTFEFQSENGNTPVDVVEFPGVIVSKKSKKAA